MKNRTSFNLKCLCFILEMVILGGELCTSTNKLLEIEFEKSPKFNCVEKEYKALVEVAECNGNFANDYIFDPWSLCVDKEGDLIGYDRLSSRIFILNKELKLKRIFGKRGNGLGDFKGAGIMAPVYLRVKRGYIYANDLIAKKVMVFDKNGYFKREVSYRTRQIKSDCKPLVDDNGNILFLGTENDGIALINEKMKTIGYAKLKKEYYYYLFKKPNSLLELRNTYKSSLILNEIMLEIANDGQLIIIFKPSATSGICNLADLTFKSISRLLPRDALNAYEKELKEMNKEYFKEMFFLIFNDESERNLYYLQYGLNIKNGKNCIYEFNNIGKLTRVLFLKNQNNGGFVRLFCKFNELYFGITDNKIKLFMEEK